eukprot:GEMP01007056.1.p1 GENE.GEMP01007056.1~~GEMP01007056.1.p1  ORF type:complete len:583 (+),score=117.41 GEMP01007056.1:14-1762(+)
MATKFKVVGYGQGGILEMREALDNKEVTYALIKWVSGTGVFQRTKFIFIHFNGDACAVVRRGKANALKSAAYDLVGQVHASLTLVTKEDLTPEFLYEHLKSIFVIDDGTFSIQRMRQELEKKAEIAQSIRLSQKAARAEAKESAKQEAAASVKTAAAASATALKAASKTAGAAGTVAAEASPRSNPTPITVTPASGSPRVAGSGTKVHTSGSAASPVPGIPKRISDLSCSSFKTRMKYDVTAEHGLSMVKKHMSPLNWAVFESHPSKLILWGSGSKSIPEIHECGALDPLMILFGLVRLGFGVGRFRRVKWVSFTWVGPNVPIMKRGKLMAHKGVMLRRIHEGIACALTIEAGEANDLGLRTVILDVQRKIIIDGKDDGTRCSDEFKSHKLKSALDPKRAIGVISKGTEGRTSPRQTSPESPSSAISANSKTRKDSVLKKGKDIAAPNPEDKDATKDEDGGGFDLQDFYAALEEEKQVAEKEIAQGLLVEVDVARSPQGKDEERAAGMVPPLKVPPAGSSLVEHSSASEQSPRSPASGRSLRSSPSARSSFSPDSAHTVDEIIASVRTLESREDWILMTPAK